MNGNLFIGSWKNDKRHGYAELTLYDGVKLEGDFVNGKEHGEFNYITPGGKII